VLVVIVLGVIGAVAVPYVLDWMNPPPTRPVASKPLAPVPATPATPSVGVLADKPAEDRPAADKAMADKPAADKPVADKPVVEKSVAEKSVAEKKDGSTTAKPADPKPAATKPDPKSSTASAEAKTRSAMPVTESTPPAARTEPAPKPEMVAKAETSKSEPRPATASKPAATPKRAATTGTASAATPPLSSASGSYWVQVGAFKDADTAKKVAAKLREEKFSVEESVTRGGGAPVSKPAVTAPAAPARPTDMGNEQYDVIVTGQTAEELNKRLAAKGLAAESSGSGMVVKPSLPLRDAVALSKDLAVEGFKVQVRRTGGSSPTVTPPSPAPSAPAAAEGGSELHRVRVGAFADRAAALAAVKQLEAKGYKPYIARGDR
jgi:cell division protein FtsN